MQHVASFQDTQKMSYSVTCYITSIFVATSYRGKSSEKIVQCNISFGPTGICASKPQEGYFQIRRSGGLDLTSSLEAKFGARSGQVHKIRGKIWEVLSPKDAKVGKSPNFGVISEIQRAKFGVFVIYIFGGKIWGQAPLPPNMEVPPGLKTYAKFTFCIKSPGHVSDENILYYCMRLASKISSYGV